MDTLGEDDVGVCMNGVSERQRMLQVLCTARLVWQPPAFHQERPKAGLALCPATPTYLGDGATQSETRILEG